MFKKLKCYYDYIENDHSLSYDFNLNKYLISLRDNYKQNNAKRKCSFEIYYNDFRFEKGILKPELTSANGSEYPSLDLFDDNLNYIVDRAKKANNPKHKAKYNHLLWESHLKNNKYCKEAIDNYLGFLSLIISKERNNIENRTLQLIFENLFVLSQKINYKKEETISFFISNLNLNYINGYNKFHLMKFIFEQGKKIDKKILQTFYNYSNEVIDKNNFPEFRKEYLSLLILLSNRTSNDVKPYHNLLAETHLKESEKHKESFNAHDYNKALQSSQLIRLR